MSKEWIKSHICALDTPKIMALPPDHFKVWQCLLWVAGRRDRDGALPPVAECAYILRLETAAVAAAMHALASNHLLDHDGDTYRIHDWEDWQTRPSDSRERVRERVARHRAASVTNVTTVTTRNECNDGNDAVSLPIPVTTVTAVTTSNGRNDGNALDERRTEEKRGEESRPERAPVRPPTMRPPPGLVAARSEHDRFMAQYPAHRLGNEGESWVVWQQMAKEGRLEPLEAMLAGLGEHVASTQWQRDGGQYVPNLPKFLRGQGWRTRPVNVVDPNPNAPARGKLVI